MSVFFNKQYELNLELTGYKPKCTAHKNQQYLKRASTWFKPKVIFFFFW